MGNGTEVEVIKAEVLTVPDIAKGIIVIDPESMAKANSTFLVIKGLRKKIADFMDPIISAAFTTHKVAVAKKKELEAPLIQAESWLNGQISIYHERQEKIRREEESRLRLIELQKELARRKEAEAVKLAEAAFLEQGGAKDEAEQLLSEILQENEAPMVLTVPQPETPKMVMTGMAMVKNWHFRIVNIDLIPRQFMIPDEVKIGAIVRSMKENARALLGKGIDVYSENKTRATGR